MGWLEGWAYRKSHVIEGSPAGSVGDYQIRIVAHYGSGEDSGEDVYLNGHARADFGDIRFTDSDGVTELPYWIEEKVDGDYAVFWVKVPSIPASPDTAAIYVYYGKPDAATTSNGDGTFLQFDDFDDLAAWTQDKASAAETITVEDGQVKFHHRVNTFCHIERSMTYEDVAVQVKLKTPASGAEASWAIALGVYFNPYDYAAVKIRQDQPEAGVVRPFDAFRDVDGAIYETFTGTSGYSTYYWVRIRIAGSTVYFDYSTDGETWICIHSMSRPATWDAPSLVIIGHGFEWKASSYSNPDWDNSYASPGSAVDTYADKYFVRRYIEPEPSHGPWGAEESVTPPAPEEAKPLYYIEYGLFEQIISMVYALIALAAVMMVLASVRKLK